MKPWMAKAVKIGAKGLAILAALNFVWIKAKKVWFTLLEQINDQIFEIQKCMVPGWVDKVVEKVKTVKSEPEVIITKGSSTGEVMKPKKKLSFFKVILILGFFVAVAIYILDRILPKPYSDEDLDDAWQSDEDEDEELEASQPPAPDETYDVTSEDETAEEVEEAEETKEEE